MDGLQAAILSAKLPHLSKWTQQRIANADYYSKVLSDIKEIVLPAVRTNTKHTFHLYVIRCKQRDNLSAFLKEKGVETAIHYPTPLPELEAYQYLGHQPNDFPIAHQYQHEILSLPMYAELSVAQMDFVADSIKEFYKKQCLLIDFK
jgi:dTDP-4-amino-4,6-dideoxygalactose transaminase